MHVVGNREGATIKKAALCRFFYCRSFLSVLEGLFMDVGNNINIVIEKWKKYNNDYATNK